MIFAFTGHVTDWPVAAGGSAAIARALASYLESFGGRIETGRRVRSLADLPPARVVLFDTSPAQLADVGAPVLPAGYVRRLRRYRYGPGAFKVDWALDGPIPWRDPRCLEASTVHVGGALEEIAAAEAAVWRGEHSDRPFVLVVQQIERFAPGFRDRILARHAMGPADLLAANPNYVGGAITGGVADLGQFFARPVARLDPYTTPNPRLFICSASTPPGGGVHGMCGAFAAGSALRRLAKLPERVAPLASDGC
jgi:phytoene dehydrogenase-like protein